MKVETLIKLLGTVDKNAEVLVTAKGEEFDVDDVIPIRDEAREHFYSCKDDRNYIRLMVED